MEKQMVVRATCKACGRGDSFLTTCYNKFIDVSGTWCACGEITCFHGELVRMEDDECLTKSVQKSK